MAEEPVLNLCGNPRHPNGAWHIATPLPYSWERRANRRRKRNIREHGCGCDVVVVDLIESRGDG